MLLTAFLPAAILLAAFPSGLLANSFETEQKCDKYFSFVRSPAGVESAGKRRMLSPSSSNYLATVLTLASHPKNAISIRPSPAILSSSGSAVTSKTATWIKLQNVYPHGSVQVDPGTPITYAVAAGEIKTYDDSNPLNTFLVDVRKYGTQTWYLCTKAIISCGGCTPWVDSAS
ncbi:hypothetical protein PtB15_5B194 [Puccinia triticina]|nr:hypothetical protein PtB15_5B194 [Puccinia triticina]